MSNYEDEYQKWVSSLSPKDIPEVGLELIAQR